jgi:predicted ester cyclase
MSALNQLNAEHVAIRRAIDGWGTEPDWKHVWEETCAPGITLHFCGLAEPVIGLSAVCAFNEALFAGFPAIQQTITGVCASGSDVAYRHRLTGRQTGPFLGLEPTGRNVDITGMTWVRTENSKIAEEWYELNHDELKRQLGLS